MNLDLGFVALVPWYVRDSPCTCSSAGYGTLTTSGRPRATAHRRRWVESLREPWDRSRPCLRSSHFSNQKHEQNLDALPEADCLSGEMPRSALCQCGRPAMFVVVERQLCASCAEDLLDAHEVQHQFIRLHQSAAKADDHFNLRRFEMKRKSCWMAFVAVAMLFLLMLTQDVNAQDRIHLPPGLCLEIQSTDAITGLRVDGQAYPCLRKGSRPRIP